MNKLFLLNGVSTSQLKIFSIDDAEFHVQTVRLTDGVPEQIAPSLRHELGSQGGRTGGHSRIEEQRAAEELLAGEIDWYTQDRETLQRGSLHYVVVRAP